MAVRTKDELIKQITDALGDNKTSDAGIALLEDIADTLDASSSTDVDDLKKQLEEANKKVEDTDKAWREKYTQRFNSPIDPKSNPDPSGEGAGEPPEDDPEEPKTFGDLFTNE